MFLVRALILLEVGIFWNVTGWWCMCWIEGLGVGFVCGGAFYGH